MCEIYKIFGGGLILMYLVIEIGLFIATRVFLLNKLLIGLRVCYQIKKMLPDWWYIQRLSYLTINKNKDDYEVYVSVRSKIPAGDYYVYGDSYTTNDFIKTDRLGTIKTQNLTSTIFYIDNSKQSKIKQWLREKNLEKLGI